LRDALIAVRAIEFASTIIIAGTIVFSILIAEPVGQRAKALVGAWIWPFRKRMRYVLWSSLFIAVAAGMMRLVLVAADITNEAWAEAIGDGAVWVVVTQTQFGLVSQTRLLFAGILVVLLLRRRDRVPCWLRVPIAAMAVLLLGSLAWTGHAGGATGPGGRLHLLSDVLHVLAAGAWIGGLVPLAILLAQLSQRPDAECVAVCFQVLRRFSNLGVASVATVFVSGVINTWFLTDYMRGLIGTDYGQLVQIKIGLFLAMVCLAADNRLRLLPQLSPDRDRSDLQQNARTLGRLRDNIALEIALGLAIVYVVGVLGVTPPAGHQH
jgi:copper resistance protein D